MWAQPLLLLLSLGASVSQARPAADKSTSPAVPHPTIKPHTCWDKGCTVEQVPVWDEVLGKCVCKWSLGPFPGICDDILCIAEMEVKYDPGTGKCGCYWIPGFGPTAASEVAVREVAAAATPTFPPCTLRCRSGYHLQQSNITGVCSCVKDPSCRGIVCISEMHPVYNYTTGRCTCQWIDGFGPPTIIYPPPASITPAPSSLAIREPAPTTLRPCTLLCIPGYHITTDSTTGLCHCVKDDKCAGIYCISEKYAVYDPKLGKCTCVWYPPFGPVSTLSWSSAVVSTTKSTPTPTIAPCVRKCSAGYHLENDPITGKCQCVPDICPDIICIAEMRATYDATTQKCGCQWIPGLEPSLVSLAARATETTPAIVKPCNLLCIQGYHQSIDANGVCTCVKDPAPCAIRCAKGYHLQYDKNGKCFCEKVVPQPCYARCTLGYHTTYDEFGQCYCAKDAEPLPCGIRCIDGYHLETSLDTGKCSCVKDPSPAVSARSMDPAPTGIIIQHPCATIKCARGYHTFINKKGVCTCVKDVEPLPCGIRCKEGYHLETSLDTGKCSCVLDPIEISQEEMCLKFTACLLGHPVWNPKTQTCTCATDDDPVLESRESISCCAATLCGPQTHPVCHGRRCVCEPTPDYEQLCLIATTCLVGSHPEWNSKTKKCSCVANADPEEICLIATTCLVGSQPVWDAQTKSCSCQANGQTICETATECITGSKPVWNKKLMKCECVRISRV